MNHAAATHADPRCQLSARPELHSPAKISRAELGGPEARVEKRPWGVGTRCLSTLPRRRSDKAGNAYFAQASPSAPGPTLMC